MKESVSHVSYGYIAELDGFRGIGILLVIFGHFGLGIIQWWFPIQGFFVLSGYLISAILISQKQKHSTFSKYFKAYWWRRVLRIFPLYYLFILLLVVVFVIWGVPRDLGERIVGLITYTFNFDTLFGPPLHSDFYQIGEHLWTLSVEEQFYIFLPLVIYFFSGKWLKVACVFFICFPIVFRFFFCQYVQGIPSLTPMAGTVVYANTVTHLDALFMGVALNVFGVIRWRYLIHLLVGIVALIMIIGLFNHVNIMGQFDAPVYIANIGLPIAGVKNYQHVWSYTLVNAAYAIAFAVTITHGRKANSWLGKLMRIPALVSFGKYSYAIYIFHLSVQYLITSYLMPQEEIPLGQSLIWFIGYTLALYVLGYISFHFFESIFLRKRPMYK